MNEPRPVAKLTPDVVTEQLDKLKRLFPEAITEGEGGPRVDFDRLWATLGDLDALAGDDAYTFTWAGKQEAFRAIQTPSAASLQPVPEESVNWDTTKHIFIEGENLEVLKLLYKSYVGKVKMIYIDPPYNTGNDFIYRDDYREPRRAYLEKTGQVDAAGNVLTSNPETRGRFHSDWLTMMYPRLFLARQLLRDDGVIFVSIDDNEVYHLRLLMNEVFGEENFIAQLVWEKTRKNDARFFSVGHEYITVFARSTEYLRQQNTYWREEKPGAADIQEEYERLRAIHGTDHEAVAAGLRRFYGNLPAGHPARNYARYCNVDDRGVWRDDNMSWPGGGGPTYDVLHPKTGLPCAVPPGGWRYSTSEKMLEMIAQGRVVFREDHTQPPIRKTYLVRSSIPGEGSDSEDEDELGVQVMGSYFYKSALPASRNLLTIFGAKVFDNPKDHEIIGGLIKYVTGPNDIVLDFFGGSGTTAQAVLDLNASSHSARRFIVVQMAEPVDRSQATGQNAARLGFHSVADIAKERIRRLLRNRMSESPQRTLDLFSDSHDGMRVFRLAPSAFRHWTPPADASAAALEQQLSYFDAGLQDRADPLHVIYEVLLKDGYSLNSTIATLTVGANTIYRITDEPRQMTGAQEEKAGSTEPPSFYLCLDDAIAPEALDALPLDDETVFICQDAALDDSQKVNLALQCVLKTI